MKIFRFLVIGWMLLWLTGNGVLAAAMPFCKHGNSHHGGRATSMHYHQMAQQEGHLHMQHGGHHAQGTAEAVMDAKPSGVVNFLCSNCDLCHLTASVLPSHGVSDMLPVPAAGYQTAPGIRLISRFPDKPLRIPLPQII